MAVVGYFHPSTPETGADLVAAFRKGLSETGYVEGRNVTIEYAWAHNESSRVPELAAELVRRRVSVIVAATLNTALAVKAATTTIPIVFNATGDPVTTGLVASLNRPGGNATGLSSLSGELGAKRFGLLHELVPKAARFALLVNTRARYAQSMIEETQAAASAIGGQIEAFTADTAREIDAAFAESDTKARGGARRRSQRHVHQPPRPNDDARRPASTAHNLCPARLCRGRRVDELRRELY